MRLKNIDRLIFVWIYRLFPSILNAITVVKPETVIGWQEPGLHKALGHGHSDKLVGIEANFADIEASCGLFSLS